MAHKSENESKQYVTGKPYAKVNMYKLQLCGWCARVGRSLAIPGKNVLSAHHRAYTERHTEAQPVQMLVTH